MEFHGISFLVIYFLADISSGWGAIEFVIQYKRVYWSFYIFLFYSGVCLGYQIMGQKESPNVPFTLFRTRFPKGETYLYWALPEKLYMDCTVHFSSSITFFFDLPPGQSDFWPPDNRFHPRTSSMFKWYQFKHKRTNM